MPLPRLLSFAGLLGILAGLSLIVDSLAVDLVGNEDALPNTLGVLVPLLSVFLVTGLFAAVRSTTPSRLLDWGYLLNTFGLILVVGIDFTRTYTLSRLDDDVVDTLLESGPTKPVFIAAGTVFVIGAILFGTALIRASYTPLASWTYTLMAAPTGFVILLPDAVGAIAQTLTGIAVTALALTLRKPLPAQRAIPATA